MLDPWAMALDTLFRGPGSLPAVYVPTSGPALPIRLIRGQRDEQIPLGDYAVIAGTNVFQIRKADVAQPTIGDQLLVEGAPSNPAEQTFVITEEALLDVEGLTWTVGVTPA